ncbi:hypothetical protein Pst134EA_019154 [Puccinia striiformis f. sp. tritici]|uniref:hypothetical protein n=1 Tax=Puccinia striiformis f. sp. tritici TaxID=168172 RepID=UPI000A123553|nr:hypothetical protein Pst134EA_019154 [Puccinia striiformis f. sp. tritici]KAH9459002.1 hypothetical protein Pst134EA_019154 [Puccinia striiformis f. sp. tritici]
MAYPLTGDDEWDQLQSNYRPSLETPSRLINFTDHGGETRTSGMSNNPPPPPLRAPGQIGPIRTHGQTHTASSISPYGPRHRAPQTHHSDLQDPNDSLSFSPSQSNATSHHRRSLSSGSSSISRSNTTSSLEDIQMSLQAISSNFQLSDDLIQRAQPLFQLTPEAKSNAILLLALHNSIIPSSSTSTTSLGQSVSEATPGVNSTQPKVVDYPSGFKTYVREHIRRILLRDDIECYGQRTGKRLNASKTPHALIKAQIQQETAAWRESLLPSGYNHGIKKKRLDSYLSDTVTNEKAILSVYLRAGLSGAESPVNVPSLWDLIATVYSNMHPDFKGMGAVEIHEDNRLTKGAKIRISYLRFMVNLNRLKSNKKVSSFWDDIDHDLHALRRHPLAYQVAYTQIIFDTDRRIWDGHHTVDQVPADQQAPPSEEGVNARIQSAMANPEPNQVQI